MTTVLQIALLIAAVGVVGGALISVGLHWGKTQSWTEKGVLVGKDALLGGTILFLITLSLWLWLELLTAGASLLSSGTYAYLAMHLIFAGTLTPALRLLNQGQGKEKLSVPTSFLISLLASPLVLLIGLGVIQTYLEEERDR